MSLLFAFDNVYANGNDLIYEFLSSEFPSFLLDNKNIVEEIKSHPAAKCVFTNSATVVQQLGNIMPTILYLNDPFYESHSSRGNNISAWRQNLAIFKNLDGIFVATSNLATSFLNTYRTPCRVQYPYVPKKKKGTPQYILYNKPPPYLHKLIEFAGSETFVQLSDESDFSLAKLYIHIPEPGEQWNINIMLAHTYGVPCITYQQGSFSEFCTSGDKMISSATDIKTWVSTFKLSLRDHFINSKIVYDMSQRFHAMNEIQQKIRKALLNNGLINKTPPTFIEAQNKANGITKLLKRPKPEESTFRQKIVRPATKSDDFLAIPIFLNNNASIYAGVGGLGDALLTIAAAQADPGSKIIFGANGGVKQTVKQLFDAMNIESLVVRNFNGSSEGLITWNNIVEHRHCKSAVHIPKDLNYRDWAINSKLYLDNTIKRMPLIDKFGKLVNPRATKQVIGLCPRGSDHTSVWKQRYISKDEFNQLVKKLLKQDATVIVFGTENDMNYYGVYQDNNVLFMNSEFAISHPAPKYSISMRHMLTAINACDEIISVDTWLKTYAALAGIPCKVIMNRYFGKSLLDYADPSDMIFLDEEAWGFKILPINDLL
jgi:hypothetical protein